MSEGTKKIRRRVVVPREVLLVEIERYCPDADCTALSRVGLTKAEARAYTGFTCGRCERQWDDSLGERDIPDWWEELKITSLEGVRALPAVAQEDADDPGEVVARMSDAWRAGRGARGESLTQEGGVDAGETRGGEDAF